jgi:hypothetical protein
VTDIQQLMHLRVVMTIVVLTLMVLLMGAGMMLWSLL